MIMINDVIIETVFVQFDLPKVGNTYIVATIAIHAQMAYTYLKLKSSTTENTLRINNPTQLLTVIILYDSFLLKQIRTFFVKL